MTYQSYIASVGNTSIDELLNAARMSDDPLARRIAEDVVGAKRELEEQIVRLRDEITELEDGAADEEQAMRDKHEAALEKLRDEMEDRIASKDEEIAHQETRIAEFYYENQKFIAEIDRLKAALAAQPKEQRPMLEQQIENLTKEVADVKAEQARGNQILEAILATLQAGPGAPVPVIATKPAETKAPEAEKPAPTETKPKDETAAADKSPEYTLDDVRAAFVPVLKARGKEAAIAIVYDIAGEVPNITRVPEDKFAAVIAALEAADQKEAA